VLTPASARRTTVGPIVEGNRADGSGWDIIVSTCQATSGTWMSRSLGTSVRRWRSSPSRRMSGSCWALTSYSFSWVCG
jgi:hypothetical protein